MSSNNIIFCIWCKKLKIIHFHLAPSILCAIFVTIKKTFCILPYTYFSCDRHFFEYIHISIQVSFPSTWRSCFFVVLVCRGWILLSFISLSLYFTFILKIYFCWVCNRILEFWVDSSFLIWLWRCRTTVFCLAWFPMRSLLHSFFPMYVWLPHSTHPACF